MLQHLPNHPDLKTHIAPQDTDDQARLQEISGNILADGLLERDLVITSSLLTNQPEDPDRYFYAREESITTGAEI